MPQHLWVTANAGKEWRAVDVELPNAVVASMSFAPDNRLCVSSNGDGVACFRLKTDDDERAQLDALAAKYHTASGGPPKSVFDVTAFGADPSGHVDSTSGVQKAFIEAANSARQAESEGSHLMRGAPLVIFPAGSYMLTDVVNISRYFDEAAPQWPGNAVALRIEAQGTAVLVQTGGLRDLLFCDQAWRVVISGLRFVGGLDQLALGNNNSGGGSVLRVHDCEFESSAGAAVRNLGPSCSGAICHGDPHPFVGSFSTQLIVRDCVFDLCDQALVSWSDWGVLADSYVITSPNMTDKGVIENHGRLHVRNILGNPESNQRSCPTNASRARWFDNYSHRVDGGMLTISNFRFGGEARGITAVVNFAPFICEEVESALESQLCGRVDRSSSGALPAAMRGAEGSSIIIEHSEFGGGCGQGVDPSACCGKMFGAEIVLEELPSQLILRDNWAQSLMDPVTLIHVSDEIDLENGSYIHAADSVEWARPTYVIDMSDSRPALTAGKIGLQEPLRAFLSGDSAKAIAVPAIPTSGSWRRGSVVLRDGDGEPLGWVCVESGWPGKWVATSSNY